MGVTSTYTIQQLKSDWEALLHGTSLSDVVNPNDVINRAARDLLADVDPMETKRIYQFSGGIFDAQARTYDYLLPADLKLNKVIDIAPQVNRGIDSNFVQHTSKEFDLYKSIASININNNTGLKNIRIAANVFPPAIFNDFEAVSGSNGTNTNSGIVGTLTADTLYKISGGASLSFTMNGTNVSATGYIENSTLTSTDLTKYLSIAPAFLWVYIPANPSNLTNVEVRWGSSSSNYWAASATTNFWSQSFVVGWNLLSFTWPSSSTGSPDVTKTTYMRVTFTWSGGVQTTFRVDDLFFALPSIYEMTYYSKYLFQDSSGNWKETCSSDSDLVNLDTDSYNLLLYKVSELAGLQIQQAIPLRGKLINFDFDTYGTIYSSALKRYKENYKTEALKVIGTYYRNRYKTIR